MSEKDTTQPPAYDDPPTQPAMQTQQPSPPAAAQLQPDMGYQIRTSTPGNMFQVPANVAYLPQVYPQGAMPQHPMQPMQPQPTGGTFPQAGGPYTPPGNIYTPPSGAYPPPGVTYPQPNNRGYPMPPGGQTRDFTSQHPVPQQAVSAPRAYYAAIPIMSLTQGAAPVDCPCCGQRAVTIADYTAGCVTHLWALISCIFIGMPCIPYFMDSAKDVKHTCGNCDVHLATWNRCGYTSVYQHS